MPRRGVRDSAGEERHERRKAKTREIKTVRRDQMEMFGVANTDSLHEFWDAALKRLKAYVEAEGRDSTFIIDDRRRDKVLKEPNPQSRRIEKP